MKSRGTRTGRDLRRSGERGRAGASQIADSRDPADTYRLDQQIRCNGAKYYYQVRNNLIHRGKGTWRDGEIVRQSLTEMLQDGFGAPLVSAIVTPLRSAPRPVVGAGWPREAVAGARKRAEEASSRAPPSVWRRVWSPDEDAGGVEERHFEPSDFPTTTTSEPLVGTLPGCGARTFVRESTMVRLMREAAERGEAVLLHLSPPDEPDLSASKRLRPRLLDDTRSPQPRLES